MKLDRYEKAKKLQDGIQTRKESLKVIERLLTSCGIKAIIEGSPRQSFTVATYTIRNGEEIRKLLSAEKQLIELQLKEMEESFAKI